MTIQEVDQLKTKLLEKKMPEQAVNKMMAYVLGELRSEQKKEANKRPVTNNTIDQLYTMIYKWYNMGLPVDGVNVIISGRGMTMVTFHGYKNKVLQIYPETQFDIQLVREGDTFNVGKESGEVVYSHTIADPFDVESRKIIGAYVVFKNKRGEFIETLGRKDFEQMKAQSKQSSLWGKWESEFMLKSVIKRACKRHFYDIIEDIDKDDNENFGLLLDKPKKNVDEDYLAEQNDVIGRINGAKTIAEAGKEYQESGFMSDRKVAQAYKDKVRSLKENSDGKTDKPETEHA